MFILWNISLSPAIIQKTNSFEEYSEITKCFWGQWDNRFGDTEVVPPTLGFWKIYRMFNLVERFNSIFHTENSETGEKCLYKYMLLKITSFKPMDLRKLRYNLPMYSFFYSILHPFPDDFDNLRFFSYS